MTARALEGNKEVFNTILRLQGFWFDVKYRKSEKHSGIKLTGELGYIEKAQFKPQDHLTTTSTNKLVGSLCAKLSNNNR